MLVKIYIVFDFFNEIFIEWVGMGMEGKYLVNGRKGNKYMSK